MLAEPQIFQKKKEELIPFKRVEIDLDENDGKESVLAPLGEFVAEINSLAEKHFPGFPKERITCGFLKQAVSPFSRHTFLVMLAEGFSE